MLQHGEPVLAELVLAEVQLDLSALVSHVRERGLPVRAPRHDPSRHAHNGTFFRIRGEQRNRGSGGLRAGERVAEHLLPAREKRIQLLAPCPHDEVEVIRHGEWRLGD